VHYGGPGSVPLGGNWDGANGDSIGVYEFNHFYLRNTNTQGAPNVDVFYGGPVDRPVPGDFDGGTHVDTVGVVSPA
jgi:hypothetical protein